MISKKEQKLALIVRIVAFHSASGWDIPRIARLMNVTTQTVINWLSHNNLPSPLATEKIQKFLDDHEYVR